MKKFIYTILFAVVTSFAISACADESVLPADNSSSDPCQFGGPGCPKK